ncbi:AI-2E family transporter [Patescibacteria group bacterium]|nr:AI-2E family transporter [Patescibacteria group bacterium]MBU1970274.1 AI-2E family transporter [Patescibacteria group bacterium]
MDKEISISIKTGLVFSGMILLGYVIYRMANVFAILGVALLIAAAVEQSVKRLVRRRIRRGLAVYTVYLILISFVISLFTIGVPPIIREMGRFLENMPRILASLEGLERYGLSPAHLAPQIGQLTSNTLSISFSFFSNMAVVVAVFFLSLYISLDWENLKVKLLSLFHASLRDEVEETIFEIEVSISQWIKGQALLMIVVGVASFLGFYFIGIEYALALAIIAGLLEFVPMIGPVITAVIASAIAFTQSPIKGLMVLVVCIIIQQLENNLLVPRIMQKVSGFSPLIILISVIAFSNFFGLVGTLVAVPCVMIGYVIIKRVLNYAGSE